MKDMQKLEPQVLKIFFSRHKIAFFILLTIVFYFSACSEKQKAILVSYPDNLKDNWNLISNTYPLPDNFTFIYESSDSENIPKITLILSEQTIQMQNIILLEKQYLVPVTDFWNSISDIKKSEISRYQHIPIDDVALPQKGLSIEGMYPGDRDYPIYEDKILSITFPDSSSEETKLTLTTWFNSIKSIYTSSKPPLSTITWIAGVGDIMIQRGVENILMHNKTGTEYIFGDTLSILKNQDILLGNLEGSITYTNSKTPKSYNFKFNPGVLPILKEAGFDYFSLTNNHIYDYGEKGFKDTLKYLEQEDIPTSGAGLTIEKASDYSEIILEDSTIRILSIGAYPQEKNGWNGRTMAQITEKRPGILFEGDIALDAVKKMTSPASFDILMLHGGVEWTSLPNEKQKDIYRRYIDAGVDIIFGSHPHVLQGMEEWNNKLIAYSLGNFIFPGMGSMSHAEESMILSVGIIDNKIKYIKPIPVNINNQKIMIDKTGTILERFQNLNIDLIRR
jgi:poly-gamma-glutamate capsule biosynthesis protein CapA/YwtB (metallophosphatase superfamily)